MGLCLRRYVEYHPNLRASTWDQTAMNRNNLSGHKIFAPMYRLDTADAAQNNPYKSRPTRRAPGNVPYVVDNLWEWCRPEGFPSRRQCVCASPNAKLAAELGGATDGKVFTVGDLVGAKLAQIPQEDARYHPDATSVHKTLVKLLTPAWLGSDGTSADQLEKQAIARLWMPCLPREEAMALFKGNPRLANIEKQLRLEIKFWDDATLVSPGGNWPFPAGEIFFEAESWCLN